jgi:chromosome segregation ATPase
MREGRDQLAALQPAYDQLRGQHETAVIELTEARERLAELEALRPEVDRLREALQQAEQRAANLDAVQQDLARQVSELDTIRAALTQIRSENEQLRPFPEKLAAREAECEGLRGERDQALANVEALQRTLAEGEQELAQLRTALEATQREAQADIEQARRHALDEKQKLEKDWRDTLREREHLAEAEVHAERARSAEALKALQQELAQVRTALAGQGAEHQAALAAVTRERDDLRDERAGVEKIAREAQRRLDAERTTAAHAIEEARRERALAQERLQVALQRLQDLESDQESAPQRLAQQAAEIERLQRELTQARLERDAAAADQSDLAEKLHSRESEFSSFKMREENYQAELARLRQALTQTRQQRDLAAQEQEALQEQVQNVQRQLDEIQQAGGAAEGDLQLSALNARLLAMTSERDDWRRRCTEAERQFDEERQSLHFQIDRLQKQLNSLRQVLQGLGIHT